MTHVAAGSTNTDAVNVAQLRGVAAVIPTYIYVNTNNPNQPSGLDPEFGGAPDANKTNHGMGNVKAGAVNPYDITIGVNAITIPDSTTSHTGQAISIGHSSTAAGPSAIAMGASAWSQMESIAIGNATQANGIASLSIGSGAKVNLDNSKKF
nr:hypothetical protein [Actinobacillus delphinicola]